MCKRPTWRLTPNQSKVNIPYNKEECMTLFNQVDQFHDLEYATYIPWVLEQTEKIHLLYKHSYWICEFRYLGGIRVKCHVSHPPIFKGWTWRPLRLLCGSLFVGLKWMEWIGLLSTFEKTARPKDTYARLIVSSSFFLVTNEDCNLMIQNINFSKYCVT